MAVSQQTRKLVRADAGHFCGYCLMNEEYVPLALELEHIIPKSKGGTDDRENLWLACRSCNNSKNDRIEAIDPITNQVVNLFNPRTEVWESHFQWCDDPSFIEGLTPIGRATIVQLKMNNKDAVRARRNWVTVGWHPPK